MSTCDLCISTGDSPHASHLAHVLGGRNPQVGANNQAVAVPTIGAFTPGYLLIAPRRHALALSELPRADRHAVAALAAGMAQRLMGLYARPVLGFEYGLKEEGARRIAHAHLHLLPTTADLAGSLSAHLDGSAVTSLADLPDDPTSSYITVWGSDQTLMYYPVATDVSPRIRLRQVVARLDPDLPDDAWDWEKHPFADLMLRTIEDLAGPRPALAPVAAGAGRRG